MTTNPTIATETERGLEQFGQDIATMLSQLNAPLETKVTVINMIPSMYPEQLDDLYETLYRRCVEQKTEELVLADDEEYQQKIEEIDQEMKTQLQDALSSVDN